MDKNTYVVGLAAIFVTAAAALFAYKQTWITGGFLALACLIAVIPGVGYVIEYYNTFQEPPPIAQQIKPHSRQVEVPTPSSPPLEPPLREYVRRNITPEYLMELYASTDMTVRSDKLVEDFIGKWIKFTSVVRDVEIGRDSETTNLVTIERETGSDPLIPRSTILFFDENWRGRLGTLTRGEEIIVDGQIAKIWGSPGLGHQVVLKHCEIAG